MKKTIVLLSILISGAGCVADDTNANVQPVAAEQALQVPAAAMSTDQICRSLMQRQRACSAAFIPALVAARVAHDIPLGVAAQDGRVGRDALVEEAFDEWAEDSKDAAIEALCDDIAEAISPPRDAELRSSVSVCMAKAGCEAFVSCAVPLSLVHWKE